jgi:hypothetical protein
MRIKVIAQHLGEGEFPTFGQGSMVFLGEECTHFLHWHSCEIEGYKTYIPEAFICDGILTRDYNPTELIAEVGEVLEVREIVYAWLLATDTKGITGWIPAESVISIVA